MPYTQVDAVVNAITTAPAVDDATLNAFIANYGAKMDALFANTGLTPMTEQPGHMASWAGIATYTNPNVTTTTIVTVLGTQYFRFSDSQQADQPIFIKVEWIIIRFYRSSTLTTLYWLAPKIYAGIDVNTVGVDGRLDWVAFDNSYLSTSSSGQSFTPAGRFQLCARPDFFAFLMGDVGNTGKPYGFTAVDRAVNIDGSNTDGYKSAVLMAAYGYNRTENLISYMGMLRRRRRDNFAITTGSGGRGMTTPWPGFNGGARGGDVYVFPTLWSMGGEGPLTCKNLLGYSSNDFVTDSRTPMPTVDGVVREFLPAGVRTGQADHNQIIGSFWYAFCCE